MCLSFAKKCINNERCFDWFREREEHQCMPEEALPVIQNISSPQPERIDISIARSAGLFLFYNRRCALFYSALFWGGALLACFILFIVSGFYFPMC